MPVDLAAAVDKALHLFREQPGPWSEEQTVEVSKLADDVFRLALAAGLAEALPKHIGSDCETKLHIAGEWHLAPGESDRIDQDFNRILSGEVPEPPRYTFLPSPPQQWFDDMEMLRSLADKPDAPNEADALGALRDEALMTSTDLAKVLNIKHEALRSRLRRWQSKNKDGGWQEISDAKPREPRYLYRVGAIRPILKALLPSK